jgi:hypothetical protein
MKRLLLMNFDDGANFGGGDGGQQWDSNFQIDAGNQAPEPTITNPLLDPNIQNPFLAPQETLDFAGRKVPVVDPILKDIHKDYSELNRTYQTTNQRVRELEQMNQQYQAMVQQFQQAQQFQAPQAPAPEPAVDLEAQREAFMDKFYENPLQAIQDLVSSQVNPVLQPITQEKQFQTDVQAMEGRYSDFRDLMPAMRDLLGEMPHLGDQGLETLYLVAKGKTAQAAPTPDQLMQDPAFIQQILSNEQIRNQAVQQYMAQRQQTNQQIPVVMGSQPGGQAPSMPENKPQSIREASKMFLKSMGLNS